MAREESKADQKQEQVRDENPFMLEMGGETREARAFVEAGAKELLQVMTPRPVTAAASVWR